jgi:DNA-binding NtrC family response regulator
MNRSSVLVVDDDRDWLELVIDALRSDGYVVQGASSGSQALSLLGHFSPTVIVTDLRMPLMDGGQLLAELRERHSAVPIVVVTGERQSASRPGLEGAFEIIEKPASLDRLLSVVSAAATTHPASQQRHSKIEIR